MTYADGFVDANDGDLRYLQYNAALNYALSKRTRRYAFATMQRALGDAQVAQSIAAASSNRQSAVAIGLRHAF
ncbi:hypothetical protein [Paraburkholderia lycopersici]|uniref:Porin n=1 Tax=Paraburkholderia lycopersici TaxID=416944 RepID=A0A1G6ZNV1_9BURK|nr:hypothetical protein [Paraburkholderia lycopersici]SDE04229.1 hypothetical protein SAMN05421548_13124 [Paraburkholderia lycopersici]